MSSKSQITVESLIDLLEKQRCTFTVRYRPLLTAQATAVQKANSLAKEPLESLKRNYSKKRAHAILNDLKNCISPDVFILCALAANPSALGIAKLGDYVSTIGSWWDRVSHPKGLTMVSERYGMSISKTPTLSRGIYPDSLEDGQYAKQSNSECQPLNDDSPYNHLNIHPVVERPQKRKRASTTDDIYPEHLLGVTDSLGSERSEPLIRDRRPEASPKNEKEIQQNSTAFPAISISCAIAPPNETLTGVSENSSNDPNFRTAQEQRVIENASLQGMATVFDEYMCGAIRRVTVDNDLKAAVTMVFPVWGGPVDCLMSLDVCEREVEQLAMALFNAKVKWADRVLHVVLNEGTTLIIPNSEITLKGVPDVAIFKVFGPEIYDAITECPVRRRELAEGKRVTECVSVILTKNGAIINLSLGLERGFQIQNKLYT